MPKKNALSGWCVRGNISACEDGDILISGTTPGGQNGDAIVIKTVKEWNTRKLTDEELRRYIEGGASECPNCHSKGLTPPSPRNGMDYTVDPPVPWITGAFARECRDCGAYWEDCYEVPERGRGLVTTYPSQAMLVPTYEEACDAEEEAAH